MRRARESTDPTDLEPGRYEVVMSPSCVADLLTFLCVYGFNGRAVEEGRSFARLGEAQFDASISLADDVGPSDDRSACRSTPRARRSVASSSFVTG